MAFDAYLLDIEGTTTPIDFVTKTLFPYARERMEAFISKPTPELEADLARLANEYAADLASGLNPPHYSRETPLEYLLWLMDHDRKSTGLKSIQGRIWNEGYENGDLKGILYPDVKPAIERWKQSGAKVCIFSSGSVLAQKLIFGYSNFGDLTPLLDGYFDTTTGPKREAESYRAIAAAIGVQPERVLFLSDVIQEVEAARNAGMAARQVFRDKSPEELGDSEEAVANFEQL
jgi:enolase-phosphatase E1